MKKVYLDSSAFFKIFFGEVGAEDMEQVVNLAKQKRIQLAISEWVVNEAIWAAVKKHMDDKISKQDVSRLIYRISEVLENGLEEGYLISYAINERVVIMSRVIIEELHLYPSDALHVLVAATSKCENILTADIEMIHRIRYGKLSLIPVNILDKTNVQQFLESV